jgi:hypothetical protein
METLDDEESMRTIIIQGKANGREGDGGVRDGGFELEERSATPSSMGRENRSAESLGFHGGR